MLWWWLPLSSTTADEYADVVGGILLIDADTAILVDPTLFVAVAM